MGRELRTHGAIYTLKWMYPEGYSKAPPEGLPRVIAEIFIPIEDPKWNRETPQVLREIPAPHGYSIYFSALMEVSRMELDHAKLATTRQKRLRTKLRKKVPLFAEFFFDETVAKKPEYWFEGHSDCELERQVLHQDQLARFEKFTSVPYHLFLYWQPVALEIEHAVFKD